jgi:hypothetical protein
VADGVGGADGVADGVGVVVVVGVGVAAVPEHAIMVRMVRPTVRRFRVFMAGA